MCVQGRINIEKLIKKNKIKIWPAYNFEKLRYFDGTSLLYRELSETYLPMVQADGIQQQKKKRKKTLTRKNEVIIIILYNTLTKLLTDDITSR